MRLLVYEFLCGGGSAADESLVREGRAMWKAVLADFAAVRGVTVETISDEHELRSVPRGVVARLHDPTRNFVEQVAEAAARAERALLIAPESDRLLATLAEAAEGAGARLLGPSATWIRLAADKHATAERLRAQGVRAPLGRIVDADEEWPPSLTYPLIAKPRSGCGSQGVVLLHAPPDASARARLHESSREGMRVETYCPGIAVSVACLCGPAGVVALRPCRQRLGEEPPPPGASTTESSAAISSPFNYAGGTVGLDVGLESRASSLAVRALAALPGARGYIGLDIALGDDPTGARDFVIEVNPRLTTSYVGLRAAAQSNLAEAWLAVDRGEGVTVEWRQARVPFDADGAVHPFEEEQSTPAATVTAPVARS